MENNNFDFIQSTEILSKIESDKIEIIEKWLSQEIVVEILTRYKVSQLFFKKHFAFRIFQSFLKVFKEKKEVDKCPVLYVLLHFSNKQLIPFQEVFLIYSGLKNEIFLYIINDRKENFFIAEYTILAQYFDDFLAGLVKDALDQISVLPISIQPELSLVETVQNKESMNIDSRIKDIRFSKEERYGSDALFEMLDVMIFDKIEQFIDALDELILILYDMEEAQGKKTQQLMAQAIKIIDEFYHLVDIMVVFPVISSTFRNLYTFLKNLDLDFYNDTEMKNLLILNLIGLIKDLEQWIDVIFIKRISDDVHYLDASFANNVLQIEAICNNTQISTDEEDDLEFF